VDCYVKGVDFTNAVFSQCNFKGVNLSQVIFRNTTLSEISLKNVQPCIRSHAKQTEQ